MNALREFVPGARDEDWKLEIAGQRVQIIKPDPRKGGVLEFGTKVIQSADGSLAGLLGAWPGASTAVAIMLQLISNGLPVLTGEQSSITRLQELVTSFGVSLHDDPSLLARVNDRTRAVLQLT